MTDYEYESLSERIDQMMTLFETLSPILEKYENDITALKEVVGKLIEFQEKVSDIVIDHTNILEQISK